MAAPDGVELRGFARASAGTVSAIDTRMRMIVALAVVSGCALGSGPVVSDAPPTYLALGDSVAFGYNPLVANEAGVAGYPEALAKRLDLPVVNAACPGEASGGFMSTTGTDNHCRENRQKYPLHVDYQGTQLAFAIDYLRAHPETDLVTIDLGANDAYVLQNGCAGSTTCVLAGFVGMLTAYQHNLDYIFGELRKVYDGRLVALAIYNPLPTDTLAQYGVDRLNTVLAGEVPKFDGVIADGRASFATAGGDDPCAAGLLIALPAGGCDIHPTAKGADLLADAIQGAMN